MSLNKLQGSRSQRINKACFETLEDRRLMSFSPAGNYAAYASSIATADFNGDGKLDIATAPGFTVNKLAVRLGDGAGGFGAAQEYPVTQYPNKIWAADLNNDARPDLVASNGDSYSTLISNGDGTFQPEIYTTWGLAAVQTLSPGFVVGLVTWTDADWNAHVQVQWPNGQGGFVAAGFDTTYTGAAVTPVDLNKDGWLDVVTGEGTVILGVPGGLQSDWGQQPPLTGGAVATGDFTGDGNADVIVAGGSVAVLRGNGDGTLQPPVHHSANGTSHSAVATADFNADGKLDAIVTDSDAGTVSVMLGNGDGTLRFGGAFATGTLPSSIAVGDFNGDGRPDVAVGNVGQGQRYFSVLLNDGDWQTSPPPPPTISVSDATVTEGNTGTLNASFTLTLNKPAAVDVTVHYDTANNTATAGSDYNAASATITIPAGQTRGTFAVAVRGDRLPEPTETFAVNLSAPTNATISDGQGIGMILDNEPRISINNVSKAEGNSNTTTLTFAVSLSADYDQAVTVNFATANGTAKAGSDYTSKSGTLTFAPGETIKTVTVVVKGDRTREANETFFVDLFAASGNSLISSARGTGTILDDDSLWRSLMRSFSGWRSAS